MAHPFHHAQSSVRKWGGEVDDYLAIHAWFDESKKIVADFRHRALRHHAEGIFLAEQVFGVTITISAAARSRCVGSASSTSPRISASSRPLPTGSARSNPSRG